MFSIVKLHATDSTNAYLKALVKKKLAKNKLVVTAEIQSEGRGQLDAIWESENFKNLTFSVLNRFDNLKLTDHFYLNCAISTAIHQSLTTYNISNLSIKWPNDIMAGSKKLGGILIENTVKSGLITQSIIGVGLNVNQTVFKNLPNASSLRNELNQEFDLDVILMSVLDALSDKISLIENREFQPLFEDYHKHLFGLDDWREFSIKNNTIFKGKIKGVNLDGTLLVELKSGSLKSYANKTIRFIY